MKKRLIAKLMGVTVLAVLAVGATPAAAAVIEFTLGSDPAVELLSYQPSTTSFTVTALLGSTSATWVQDVQTGRIFSQAVVTDTAPPTITTTTFSDVLAASESIDSTKIIPTITGTFEFESASMTVSSAVPEPSTWAMMLVGFAGLGFAFRRSRRKLATA
jgi:hypothetical protein